MVLVAVTEPTRTVGEWIDQAFANKKEADAAAVLKRKIYIIGSLRSEQIQPLAEHLREQGHAVFDDWFSPGPQTDQYWQDYETTRGRSYKEALNGEHAKDVFNLDKKWLDWADTAILVADGAGRSAHLEAGWAAGQGKQVFVLFDSEPDRFDIMYKLVTDICFSYDELDQALVKTGLPVTWQDMARTRLVGELAPVKFFNGSHLY